MFVRGQQSKLQFAGVVWLQLESRNKAHVKKCQLQQLLLLLLQQQVACGKCKQT